jgi:hypothetical protein
MMKRKLWLVAGIGLLVTNLAAAQAPTGQKPLFGSSNANPDLNSTGSGQREITNSRKMYEDIEIMRRILNRKLGLWSGLVSLNGKCTLCHQVSGNHMVNLEGLNADLAGSAGLGGGQARMPVAFYYGVADFHQTGMHDELLADPQVHEAHASLVTPTNIEGVYLTGQGGVVYTLTLPPPPRSRATATKKTILKPLNDWERFSQSVRGDEVRLPKRDDAAKQSNEIGILAELEKRGCLGITDAILKILADNGQHFSQLPPDEKITVAITFRNPPAPAGIQSQIGNQAANPLAAWGNLPDSPTTWEADTNRALNVVTNQGMTPPGGSAPGGGLSVGGASSEGAAGGLGSGSTSVPHTASVRDYELLGDMHIKQGKAQEAIKAFQRALNLSPPPKHTATLYRKIARAQLMLEDDTAAEEALKMAAENMKLVGDPSKNSGTAATGTAANGNTPSNLPEKLIISAPKKLLDQVAAGKVTYADFRRQATIDFFGFPSVPASSSSK